MKKRKREGLYKRESVFLAQVTRIAIAIVIAVNVIEMPTKPHRLRILI
jgi:hypothetical protein